MGGRLGSAAPAHPAPAPVPAPAPAPAAAAGAVVGLTGVLEASCARARGGGFGASAAAAVPVGVLPIAPVVGAVTAVAGVTHLSNARMRRCTGDRYATSCGCGVAARNNNETTQRHTGCTGVRCACLAMGPHAHAHMICPCSDAPLTPDGTSTRWQAVPGRSGTPAAPTASCPRCWLT